MSISTSPHQRGLFYQVHQEGMTYSEIGEHFGVSKECVRYWYRRQRDGQSPETRVRRKTSGHLGRFDPKVYYVILRLRIEHPRWGPSRMRHKLTQRPSLRGLALPSPASIGRYLHQWRKFRRHPNRKPPVERLSQPRHVHQRWQIDFKEGIRLQDGSGLHLHTVRDPLGEACLAAYLFLAGKPGQSGRRRVKMEEVRWVLRQCFAHGQTLPFEIQTDGEPALVPPFKDAFPSLFTLWRKGLGIDHGVIHQATHNAEVERCHRTVHDYAMVGNERLPLAELQAVLDQAVFELTYQLPSRAAGCAGLPPIQAHPELIQPLRPFQAQNEFACFDLQRVDAFLALFTWQRRANGSGCVRIGWRNQYYYLGVAYAQQDILVRFDPQDRCFVFFAADDPEVELKRCRAKNLETSDLLGLYHPQEFLVPQQLPLPLFSPVG
jgi:hypothetical protein